jgi:hypothetical protein
MLGGLNAIYGREANRSTKGAYPSIGISVKDVQAFWIAIRRALNDILYMNSKATAIFGWTFRYDAYPTGCRIRGLFRSQPEATHPFYQ